MYVGQREMAVGARGDGVELLGSEDATTCHIVIIRDVSGEAGVTGVAHIDRLGIVKEKILFKSQQFSDEPEQFLALERAVRDRCGWVESDFTDEL